jgi:DNA-binding NarL/FixJ family response regulator
MERGLPVILFIDPDGSDASIIKEALARVNGRQCNVLTAEGIEEAERTFESGVRVDVIFLRLMPGSDQVSSLNEIEELRSHKAAKEAPVVVFADRDDREFVNRVYEFPMTCYVRRTNTRDEYVSALRNALDFWCSTAVLPRRPLQAAR